MTDPIVSAAKTEATQLAAQLGAQAKGVAQSWLRRNVWGVLAVAVAAVMVAAFALLWS